MLLSPVAFTDYISLYLFCHMHYAVTIMDARNMEYLPNECFNCIIDKALFDTFLCSNTNHSDIHAYITEMFRILKSEGKFIIISHGNPDSGRIEFVRNNLNVDYGWEEDVECKHIGKCFVFVVYIYCVFPPSLLITLVYY